MNKPLFALFAFFALSASVFAATDYCTALEQYQKKAEFYIELASSQERIESSGLTKEQLQQVMLTLEASISKAKEMCALESTDSAQTQERIKSASGGSSGSVQTANTENAAQTAIEARQKAANSRSETANAHLNVTSSGTAPSAVRAVDKEDDLLDIGEAEALESESEAPSAQQAKITGASSQGKTATNAAAATTAREVSAYYKQKLQTIVQSSSTDEQIASLKELRNEIDSMISGLLAKQNRISLNESGLGDLVQSVKITPTAVQAGGVEVASTGKIVDAKVSSTKEVEVEAKEGKVVLRDNGVEASATDVTVTQEGVKVGSADISISPSEAANRVNAALKKITIATTPDNRAVYKVEAQTKAKLIGVLPVTINRTVSIDSENGNVLSDQKPWWAVLAIEDDVQAQKAK